MKPLLVVNTLLAGIGRTGVETHFNQIIAAARERDADAMLVNPYTGRRWIRAPFRFFKNIKTEAARIVYRRGHALAIEVQLRSLLNADRSRSVILYSQCPLALKAASRARRGSKAKLIGAIHYNVSESDEAVAKRIARPAGRLDRNLLKLEREALPLADELVFVSDFMRRTVNGRLQQLDQGNQHTLFNFPGLLKPAATSGIARDLIAIGTLEPRKNQAFLLEVLSAARKLGKYYTLTLAGDGPDRPALEHRVQSLRLSEQVEFLGFHPNAASLIPHHRALVHAATIENCPLIITEALAWGRPIFAAPVGGIPEMFSHGVEGSYWNLREPDRAAGQLVALLESDSRYWAASEAAQSTYREKFANLEQRWMDFLFSADSNRLEGRQPSLELS